MKKQSLICLLLSGFATQAAFGIEFREALYEPNYFGGAFSTQKGPLEDDPHAEFYLALRYSFNEPEGKKAHDEMHKHPGDIEHKHPHRHGHNYGHEHDHEDPPGGPLRYSFIYKGLYDFYFGSRDSSPVISRRQNPGFTVDWNPTPGKAGIERNLSIGWFHESNGQTLDSEGLNDQGIDDGVEEFERRVARDNLEVALTEVSRGWDYLSLKYQSKPVVSTPLVREDKWLNWALFETELRLYCDCQGFGVDNREDELWWKIDDDRSTIADFDGLRFRYELSHGDNWLYRANLKTGISWDKMFRNIGGEVSVMRKLKRSWVTFYYFNGYGKDLGTYHRRTTYYGIRFEFR